jgi:hypothetical protein
LESVCWVCWTCLPQTVCLVVEDLLNSGLLQNEWRWKWPEFWIFKHVKGMEI